MGIHKRLSEGNKRRLISLLHFVTLAAFFNVSSLGPNACLPHANKQVLILSALSVKPKHPKFSCYATKNHGASYLGCHQIPQHCYSLRRTVLIVRQIMECYIHLALADDLHTDCLSLGHRSILSKPQFHCKAKHYSNIRRNYATADCLTSFCIVPSYLHKLK